MNRPRAEERREGCIYYAIGLANRERYCGASLRFRYRFACFTTARKGGEQQRRIHEVVFHAGLFLHLTGGHAFNPNEDACALNPFHLQAVGGHLLVASS